MVAPIRERFEIQVVPPGWGRLPFLAVTDTSDQNLARFEGKWDEAGFRLAEHSWAGPQGLFLWCWENPYPDRPVERIELIPRGGRFIVAGITTSDVDEHPFVQTPSRPVRLVAEGRAAPGCPSTSRWTGGWPAIRIRCPARTTGRAGERPTEQSAYTSIAALPSATVLVRQGEDELGPGALGRCRTGRAARTTGRVSLELAEDGRNWVHVTVVDEETGRPVPCRVHFRSPQGIPYQPHGHHNHVTQNLGSWH